MRKVTFKTSRPLRKTLRGQYTLPPGRVHSCEGHRMPKGKLDFVTAKDEFDLLLV